MTCDKEDRMGREEIAPECLGYRKSLLKCPMKQPRKLEGEDSARRTK